MQNRNCSLCLWNRNLFNNHNNNSKNEIGEFDSTNLKNTMVFIKRHHKYQGGKICHNWKDTFAICIMKAN